jgi:Ca-activated chloride channel family protein
MFGVGEDFDELLLRDMAREGGGNFYFIESSEQIPAVIARELGEQMEITMPGASLDVSLPEGATAHVLHHFRSTVADNGRRLSVSLGDLVSGQEVICVLRLTFPLGTEGAEVASALTLRSSSPTGPSAATTARVAWTYATHEENDLQPRDVEVDREVARIYAARARAEATEANRLGEYSRAMQVVERVARRISAYAGADTTLNGIVRELHGAVATFEAPLMPMALKQEVFAAYSMMSSRSATGFARRSPEAEDRADGA